MSLIADTFFETDCKEYKVGLMGTLIDSGGYTTGIMAGHLCVMEPSNKLSYRNKVLGQYHWCRWCGKQTWEEIPEENENSN